ncbi:hypothetical protein HAX54_020807 [Datura stramonium]|uniref:Thionin-like protein 2 n=1 Tax=Datura stramonium TaxID=4076 RepID=A0ABS8S377_DATST|nr:hypothetical protein [Datura stramonium]
MESMKLRAIVTALVFLGFFAGQSNAAFSDCYTRCFIFCMIDPSETVCKCTTKCLKQCIFNSDSDSGSVSTNSVHHKTDSSNLKFCKLGCAFSTCSTVSKKHQPNGEKMEDCVGSCSRNCTKSY